MAISCNMSDLDVNYFKAFIQGFYNAVLIPSVLVIFKLIWLNGL